MVVSAVVRHVAVLTSLARRLAFRKHLISVAISISAIGRADFGHMIGALTMSTLRLLLVSEEDGWAESWRGTGGPLLGLGPLAPGPNRGRRLRSPNAFASGIS